MPAPGEEILESDENLPTNKTHDAVTGQYAVASQTGNNPTQGEPPVVANVFTRTLHNTHGFSNDLVKTSSSPRRTFFIHALLFECTSKLCITFLNQLSVCFHI